MANQYCTTEDVKEYLPDNIVVEGENPSPNPFNPAPETLTTVNIEFFIKQASNIIDSRVGTIYHTPLKKVNNGGDIGFPEPVPSICAILSAQMIWEQRLQGTESQRSESQKEREKFAMEQLQDIQDGKIRLWGIRATRGSRYVRNTGRNSPFNPSEGGSRK